MQNYSRDKRSPKPKDANTSKVMRANKSKNTNPEILLRKALWNNNIRGYRLHTKNIAGKPDICFVGKKIAVFVNGCFWHRCPHCNFPLPKNNSAFWINKFEKNKTRDLAKTEVLKTAGWQVLTIWECDLKKDIIKAVNKIKKLIS